MKLLTTADAAEKLGVSQRRVLALINDGRLPAQRLGRDYLIDQTDLKLVKNRKPGRPAGLKNKPNSVSRRQSILKSRPSDDGR